MTTAKNSFFYLVTYFVFVLFVLCLFVFWHTYILVIMYFVIFVLGENFTNFLFKTSHFYASLCRSVGWWVSRLVGQLAGWSAG